MEIGEIKPEEIVEAAAVVTDTFTKYIAPGYSEEGIAEFSQFVQPEIFLERLKAGSLILVSRIGGRLAGVIEILNNDHISLLFTAADFHRQGIAAGLLAAALSRCRENDSQLSAITVNSSPFAVGIYERLGFKRTDREQLKNGIRFTPMVKQI